MLIKNIKQGCQLLYRNILAIKIVGKNKKSRGQVRTNGNNLSNFAGAYPTATMKATELTIQLADLEMKSLQLIAAYSRLKQEHQHLLAEHTTLRETLKQQQTELRDLRKKTEKTELDFQNSQKITKLVKSIQADTENAGELKEKLDEFIQEISKCISFLSV